MSQRRRNGLGGWLSRLKTWQQVGIFLGLTGAVGTAVTSFERQYGVVAENFGFARSLDVADSVQDLKAWQLYSDIRRVKRQVFDMGTPNTERDRERFEDLANQLATMQVEYDRISKKRRP